MNALLKRLSVNPAVQTLLHRESGLGNLSATEEALLLAAAFDQDPQTMIVVKNNTYTAQRLQERLEPLLHDKALLFVMEESLRVEAIAASPELKASQIEVMARLTEGGTGGADHERGRFHPLSAFPGSVLRSLLRHSYR